MPRVRMCNCCLTIFTINAFWSGVALQHRTAAQWRVKWRNGFCRLERLSKIYLQLYTQETFQIKCLITCLRVEPTATFFRQQPKLYASLPCWNCRMPGGKRTVAYYPFHSRLLGKRNKKLNQNWKPYWDKCITAPYQQ